MIKIYNYIVYLYHFEANISVLGMVFENFEGKDVHIGNLNL